MREEKREPFDGICECGHRWTLAYTPMEVGKFCRIIRNARCPMCGAGSKKIKLPMESENAKTDSIPA